MMYWLISSLALKINAAATASREKDTEQLKSAALLFDKMYPSPAGLVAIISEPFAIQFPEIIPSALNGISVSGVLW